MPYETAVEFSQDEGFIGLPSSVATALLQPDGAVFIDSKLTVDPAKASQTDDSAMDIESNSNDGEINAGDDSENLEEKTPGHLAYGLFPVPVPRIEVTLLTHLPRGMKCTLQPSVDAIANGFYNLKNVKLALEQSLIRTRGSLNVGDRMYCWFRGKKFDLNVQNVEPADLGAISCVNCDIEVDIAPPPVQNSGDSGESAENATAHELPTSVSGGYRLSDGPMEEKPSSSGPFETTKRNIELPPEPPEDQKDNVIVVQIRGAGKVSRRRFETSATVKSLFDFAISADLIDEATVGAPFKLVTQFPRRVYQVGSIDEDRSLGDLGLAKQEMFIVEKP